MTKASQHRKDLQRISTTKKHIKKISKDTSRPLLANSEGSRLQDYKAAISKLQLRFSNQSQMPIQHWLMDLNLSK